MGFLSACGQICPVGGPTDGTMGKRDQLIWGPLVAEVLKEMAATNAELKEKRIQHKTNFTPEACLE